MKCNYKMRERRKEGEDLALCEKRMERITIVTGKNMKYNGKTRNGFSLAKKDIFGQEGKDDAA